MNESLSPVDHTRGTGLHCESSIELSNDSPKKRFPLRKTVLRYHREITDT